MRLPAALLAVALLAGCTSAPATDTATTTGMATATGTGTLGMLPNVTVAPDLPARLDYVGCRQLHTFFPFPVTAMQQLGFALPDGFTMATSDPAGQMADVFVAWWFCADGLLNHTIVPRFGPGGSMMVGIHVTPPSSYANASVDLDLVPLTWLVSSTTAARYLESSLGHLVEAGDVQHTGGNDLGAAVTDSGTAAPSFGTFGVDTAVQAAPGPNPLSAYRVWAIDDNNKVTGYLDIANQPGTTVGMGGASLRFLGDPSTGAPPIIPGTAHVVAGVDVHLTPRPLPA